MKAIILILTILTLVSCNPKIITNSLVTNYNNRSHLYYEPFAFIEIDTIDKSSFKRIGNIIIKDTGFSLDCSYETMKKLAKQETLKIGGN